MTNMENNEDKILDEEQWKLEAQSVINDIKNHVNDVKLSDRLCMQVLQSLEINTTTLRTRETNISKRHTVC
ncbi:hypothetical protein HZH66_001277 [Vespula vulgaris]|uniref:Uncharacterized protein n=1 Tax=Vespula vulgaris TaxID=7454 RepID=A0A834KYF2_VESVU|nr:hypothetical protein HZH66_001277 [Vespula vulgaris]